MNMIIQAGKKLNIFKKIKQREEAKYLSCVRRIDRVHPVAGARVCAMTFDDGPCKLPPNPARGIEVSLTEHLAETLKQYGAAGTFNIIGDTSANYPDKEGALNGPYWGGERFDHYPAFGQDDQGGAYHHPELVKLLLTNGNEVANHGYLHRLFGKKRAIYGKRAYLESFDEVVADLKNLDELIQKGHGFQMSFSRPPHYIDAIAGGYDSYHAYQLTGYQYLAASFDAGGWLATSGDYDKDVQMMVTPLASTLKANPDALNGHIIFQKDGFNMSKQTPVAHALEQHLKLLSEYGYRIVPVSELLALSPVRDMPGEHPAMTHLKYLLDHGHAVCYRNNTFMPSRPVTMHELLVMLCPRHVLDQKVKRPYEAALDWAKSCGIFPANVSAAVSKKDWADILAALHTDYSCETLPEGPLKRIDVVEGIFTFSHSTRQEAASHMPPKS